MPYAVVVTFEIKRNMSAAFMPHMLSNARASLRDESGCLQFDVVTDPTRPREVFLYEIYEDRAAFETHMATAHFKTFEDAASDMIASKDVRTFTQVVQ